MTRTKRWSLVAAGALTLIVVEARPAYAMHIMEGFLPPLWAAIWFAVAIPFWVVGLRRINRLIAEKPETRLLLGLAGAFAFVLSALKIPSVTRALQNRGRGCPYASRYAPGRAAAASRQANMSLCWQLLPASLAETANITTLSSFCVGERHGRSP